MDLFDGLPSEEKPNKPFFLATGKTGRDYGSLVKGSALVNAEVRIIGPSHQKPDRIPPNVTWIDTSKDPPDQAIDYPTLREWYAQCTAVCIPLSGDSDDTCGYTNMLEGMAMRKPVLMTHSGCLHIDPESGGFGKLIEPQDNLGWTDAMNYILKDQELARTLGEEGRRMTEKGFTIERFNRDVLNFLRELLENRQDQTDPV
jgi:glycosyltransferase involved in cell wall biosynthesis